jgi:putative hydrolase of the HAD superfamily
MIRAVLFDLFETLITESHIQPTRASSLAATLRLEREVYRAEWKARRPRILVGELSFAGALTQVLRAVNGTVDAATIQGICQQRIREKAAAYASIDSEVTGLISELVRRNVKLGVISNGFKEDVLPWPGCVLATAFQSIAFSCDERIAKPDPEIYMRALDRLEVVPGDAVYIGDGGDDELAGAEQAGLRAFRAAWFTPGAAGPSAWPELTRCADVLPLVAAG